MPKRVIVKQFTEQYSVYLLTLLIVRTTIINRTIFCLLIKKEIEMSRKRVLAGGKRDMLISTALKLFMKNGYENTSVRMILNEVNGEVGMFYYYFSSKDELFEAAVELYFRQYSERFRTIVTDVSLSLPDQMNLIFQLFETSSKAYLLMNRKGGLHWTVEIALREKTLDELEPYIVIILQNAISAGIIRNPDVALDELAAFILHGVAGVMHQESLNEITPEFFSKKRQDAIRIIASILRVSPEIIGGCNQ